MQPGREERAVNAGCELLHASVQRLAAGCARRGLDNARGGIRLGHANQTGDARAAHHAVGIQHDHVAVVLAPAPAEVGDVTALALDPMPSPAVEDATEAAHGATKPQPRCDFGDPRFRIAAVGEHEEVEVIEFPGHRHRSIGGTQACKDARNILVADRHDDRPSERRRRWVHPPPPCAIWRNGRDRPGAGRSQPWRSRTRRRPSRTGSRTGRAAASSSGWPP